MRVSSAFEVKSICQPLLWRSLSLGSLMFTVSRVGVTPLNSSASFHRAIAQANLCAGKKENVGGPLAPRLAFLGGGIASVSPSILVGMRLKKQAYLSSGPLPF